MANSQIGWLNSWRRKRKIKINLEGSQLTVCYILLQLATTLKDRDKLAESSIVASCKGYAATKRNISYNLKEAENDSKVSRIEMNHSCIPYSLKDARLRFYIYKRCLQDTGPPVLHSLALNNKETEEAN